MSGGCVEKAKTVFSQNMAEHFNAQLGWTQIVAENYILTFRYQPPPPQK